VYVVRRWQRSIGILLVVVGVGVALPVASVSAQGQRIHVVQAGDTLWSIASRYGMTVGNLVTANGLSDAGVLYIGQRLLIPGSEGEPGTSVSTRVYVIRRGDTLSAIALRNGVTLLALLQANGLSKYQWIYPGQRLVIPSSSGTLTDAAAGQAYVVKAGDTLGAIAVRFRTTTFELARLNGIVDPSRIYVGQSLRITSQAGVALVPHAGNQRILIDLSEQHLYAYSGESLVYSLVCSSGAAPYYTRTGEFQVQSKIPNAYGSTWGIWMPHWLGIYWAGSTENGIHALPIMQNGRTLWSGYLGQPVSYGCIVLGTAEAKLLFDWAEVGTPVSIRS